jgi:hypothetical protein
LPYYDILYIHVVLNPNVMICKAKQKTKNVTEIEDKPWYSENCKTKCREYKQEAHVLHRPHESPRPILKDFLFLYAFYFLCGHYTQFHVMCKGDHCLVTPQAFIHD